MLIQNKMKRYKADIRVKLASGREKWVSDSAIPLKNEKGEVTHSLGILMDITERKEAEEKLRQHHLAHPQPF